MSIPERPRLRMVEAKPVQTKEGEQLVLLEDPLALSDEKQVLVPIGGLYVCQLLDGTRTIDEVARDFQARHKVAIPKEQIEALVKGLDEALLLAGDRAMNAVAAWKKNPIRKAKSAGASYPDIPVMLMNFLDEQYTRPGGPGAKPDRSKLGSPVRGLLSPHIDFNRGGHSYAHAWKAVAESCEADTFVVFGTAHYGTERARFALTRKDYETPLGTLKTDQELLEKVVSAYKGPDDLFEGELAHKHEHSIEFQMVQLAHLYGELSDAPRKIKVLPVLCGGLHDLMGAVGQPSSAPSKDPGVRAFHEALAKALAGVKRERICVVGGVDFAHVGVIFDDPPVTDKELAVVMEQDRKSLEIVNRVDADAFHEDLSRDKNARRVCGHSAIAATLARLSQDEKKLKGEVLHHDRWYDGQSSVSFASVVYRDA
jgi:AmmeMemoRadiSam system protein B